jgi:hypothetical protein
VTGGPAVFHDGNWSSDLRFGPESDRSATFLANLVHGLWTTQSGGIVDLTGQPSGQALDRRLDQLRRRDRDGRPIAGPTVGRLA